MHRAFLLALPLLAIACARAPLARPTKVVTVAPAPKAPAPVEIALLSRDAALAEARARFAAAEIRGLYEIPEHAAGLARGGLDEGRTALLVRSALAACLARPDPCVGAGVLPDAGASKTESTDRETVRMLVEQLGALANESTLELLVRLDAHGVDGADEGIEEVLERRATSAGTSCAPPSAAELDAQRDALGDLTVFDGTAAGGKRRLATPSERDDLAYFRLFVGSGAVRFQRLGASAADGRVPRGPWMEGVGQATPDCENTLAFQT